MSDIPQKPSPTRPSGSWNAGAYAKNSAPQFAWAQELISKLPLAGDESLLDIGCGDGKITALFAYRLPRGNVVGIDASPEMINYAQNAFPPIQYQNLTFRLMDAMSIDLPRMFNRAFSNAAMHWMPDQPAVLAGVHRSLLPGGRLLFQMGGRGNADNVFEIADDLITLPRWEIYFRGFISPYHLSGPEEYREWLPAAGFMPVRVELIPKDMQHASPEKFTNWLRTTWFPFTDRVPETLREELLTELTDAYIREYPPDATGAIHTAMQRLEIEAIALP